MTMIRTQLNLVMIRFVTDDENFRHTFFNAILDGDCPDFERSYESTGKQITAFWHPEHVDAVRTWSDKYIAAHS